MFAADLIGIDRRFAAVGIGGLGHQGFAGGVDQHAAAGQADVGADRQDQAMLYPDLGARRQPALAVEHPCADDGKSRALGGIRRLVVGLGRDGNAAERATQGEGGQGEGALFHGYLVPAVGLL